MSDMRLVVAIINFLKHECEKPDISADTAESLEVAVQCLQTAYDLKPEDLTRFDVSRSLSDIFKEAVPSTPYENLSHEEQAQAEGFKTYGNELMKADKIGEAVDAYTQAIEINGSNAVYYCNRAAAYSKLGLYKAAIKDCELAVSLDPNYSKAYGRMGLAYSSLDDIDTAIDCYRKAVELDPTNESSKANLQIALEKRKADKLPSPGSTSPQVDVSAVLNNPLLRNMASTVMQDPNMVNLVSGFMSNSLNEGGGNESGFDALLQAGQRLAAQMQATNPELVEQLRQQFAFAGPNPNPPNSENNDPASKQS